MTTEVRCMMSRTAAAAAATAYLPVTSAVDRGRAAMHPLRWRVGDARGGCSPKKECIGGGGDVRASAVGHRRRAPVRATLFAEVLHSSTALLPLPSHSAITENLHDNPRADARSQEPVDDFAAAIHARFATHPTHLARLTPSDLPASQPNSPFIPRGPPPPLSLPTLPPPMFRAEGFHPARQVAWLRGGYNAVWRDRPDLLDSTPLPDEDGEDDDHVTDLPLPNSNLSIGPLPHISAPEMSRSTSIPPQKALRPKALPMSAFTSASTMAPPRAFPVRAPSTSTAVSAAPSAGFAPATPAPGAVTVDPFSTIPVATPGPSLLAARTKSNPLAAQLNLRLPRGASAPSLLLPTRMRVPVRGGEQPAADVVSVSSMPGGMRGHHSVPHARQVAFNPFFDAIRQNLELAHGAESAGAGEGSIALRLPRRVRRRVGDLPFEWLREIARKSGRAKEVSSEESEGESVIAEDRTRERKSSGGQRQLKEQQQQHNKHHGHGRTHGHHHHTSKHLLPAKLQQPRSTTPPSSPPESPTRRSAAPLQPMNNAESSPDEQSSSSQSPPSAEDLTRALELQFYRIELGEQRRLMGVMEHHSRESATLVAAGAGVSVSSAGIVGPGSGKEKKEEEKETEVFPFSITAGLEKGNKNRPVFGTGFSAVSTHISGVTLREATPTRRRYRHIWPFEHARVRLRKTRPGDDDYMNASYVQPLGTKKRYIATQGPLPATYDDFWTLCWEQNVHVIVMLTREIEGATTKCGKYWVDGEYGPIRLKLLATDDTPERERHRHESEISGGFFGGHIPKTKPRASKARKDKDSEHKDADDDSDHKNTVRRVFRLTHTGYPHAPPRTVTQFQYLDWPDFNVPEDPRGVLGLIREVEEAVARSRGAGDQIWGEGPLQPGPWPPRFTIPTPSSPKTRPSSTVIEGVSADDNDIEPTTGIARHALGNPPVLLHCSAGVGRTGGFIAVDAVLDGVRREMRKRKEETEAVAAALGSASAGMSGSAEGGSRSRSTPSGSGMSSRGEPMDVDSSPSPPPSGNESATAPPAVSELMVPVSAGDSEVHVRVAGFAESVPMDVDESRERVERQGTGRVSEARRSEAVGPAGKKLARTVLPASSELIDEVRRATMYRWESTSTVASVGDSTMESSKDSETSSSDSFPLQSGKAFTTRFTSGTGSSSSAIRSVSHSSTSPPTSQMGSSTSLSAAVTNKMSLRPSHEKASSSSESVNAMDVDVKAMDAPVKQDEEQSDKPREEPSRLDTWRSEVRTSGSPPREGTRSASKSPELADVTPEKPAQEEAEQQGAYFHRKTVDYAQPRRLHEDVSPPLLSTFDEPIRRVVEDMREQRMSLCQSLRQYVFVHRAVIEGALMIVDEEREREVEGVGGDAERLVDSGVVLDMSLPVKEAIEDALRTPVVTHRPGSPLGLHEQEDPRKRNHSDAMRTSTGGDGSAQGGSVTMSPGRPKRGASPTELQKESKRGEVMLTKRPSIKRGSRVGGRGSGSSDGDSSASAEFEVMPEGGTGVGTRQQ
ncbi:uncharacterized protein LAESUDRAFT_712524 [Laetiporus sulphureus 93-53]|uniref:Phosphatases II n=1 Tax=Laetiporus sulphureus 93-53 TaxID=1314785 RepID=A0A165FG20_9APHY|nr:uncharacterized protein LAESUDRAFT_712524 [Laetiporus sulphureus 93-53]KZT08918.1 hypothetical protein LAESUDRAFT_712524 [Laetiporus sulphureus 93-53]